MSTGKNTWQTGNYSATAKTYLGFTVTHACLMTVIIYATDSSRLKCRLIGQD